MLNNPISSRIQNTKRFQEIVKISTKYGFADWVRDSFPEFIKEKFVAVDGQDISTLPWEKRLSMALMELGPTFIKLGQMLSMRSDLIGPKLAEELSTLQADVPADAYEIVQSTIESEFGKPIDELFADIDPQALSSASIGQVHLARLIDGTEVIVKVQHPGIEAKVKEDFNILATLVGLAEKNNTLLRQYQPMTIIAEFRRSLMKEMDFLVEMRSLNQFIVNFEDEPFLHIPHPYPEYSSRRVLTMEILEGYSVAHLDQIAQDGVDTEAFTQRLINVFLTMIFRDGFYHADPHPGNIYVLPGERIGLLDCGKVGRVDEPTQEAFSGILQAFISQDSTQLAENLIRFCTVPYDLDFDAFQADIGDLVDGLSDQLASGSGMSEMVNTLFEVIREYHIIAPTRVVLLFTVFLLLEGTASSLNPQFNFIDALQPHMMQIMIWGYSPKNLFRKGLRSYNNWNNLIKDFPRNLSIVINRLRDGQIEIQVHLQGLDKQINRVAYSVLTAAIFLGSAFLWGMNAPPLVNDISVVGVLGTIVSVFLLISLLWNIRKSGGR